MSTPVIIVLAVVAMVTLVAIAAVVTQLLARLRRLAGDVAQVERELMPRVQQLQRDADVTGREIERLGQAIDEVGRRRATRRDPAR